MTGPERLERRAKAFGDMESDIADLAQMAFAACLLIEMYDTEKRSSADAGFYTGAGLVKHTEQWFSAADFSVHHLHDMAAAMKRSYYEALEAG